MDGKVCAKNMKQQPLEVWRQDDHPAFYVLDILTLENVTKYR